MECVLEMFFLLVLGLEPRILHMLGRYSTTELHLQPLHVFKEHRTWDKVRFKRP